MKVFIILVSLFCVSQATDQYRKYIEQSIDYDVDPCDNFYRHACINTTTQTLDKFLSSHIHRLLDETHIKMTTPALEKFTNVASYFSRRDFTAQLVKQFQKQYLNRCQSESLDVFLKEVQTLYSPSSACISKINQSSDCQSSSQEFIGCFENFPLKTYQKTLLGFTQDSINLNWIEQYGIATINRMNSTLQDVKKIAIELIKATPWLKYYGETEEFEHFAEKTIVADYSSVRKNVIPLFEKQSEIYTDCVSNSTLQDSPRHVLCLYQLFKHPDLQPTFVTRPEIQTTDDASNYSGTLYFHLTYFYISQYISDIAEYMAYAGFTVGHEFGHSIVTAKHEPAKYSEVVRNCIQNQFNRSCSYFAEGSCMIDDAQIGDNGADIIGFQIIYDLLKQEVGDKLHELVAGFKKPTTYEQLFFYAYAGQWCAPYPTEDGLQHQAKVVRTNAVLIQHDEFRKAFGCSDQSKMVQSNNGKCNIFGPDAPQTKSRKLEGF